MGPMPLRSVSKTQTLLDIDRILEDAVNRAKILKRIIDGDDWLHIVAEERLITSQEKQDTYQDLWFGDVPPAYWPAHEHKKDIFLDGFRKALELSLDFKTKPGFDDRPAYAKEVDDKIVEVGKNTGYGIPVVSYWFCAGDEFLCVVSESKHQITLNLMTPKFPENILPTKALTRHERIWIVSDKRQADTLRIAATKYATSQYTHTSPVSETRLANVYCTPIYG